MNACTNVLLTFDYMLQDSLPPVLYIQMDNTCGDNKNKYILTFAAILVELGIFRKVYNEHLCVQVKHLFWFSS